MAKNDKILNFPTKYSESVEIGSFETFRKPSMTEPDNAMSIPEIIARFTRGYGIDVPVHPWESGTAFEGEDPEKFFDDFGLQKSVAPKEPEAPAPEAPKEAPEKQEGE